MTEAARSPLTPSQLVDEYFIENRNRVLELAAFLDRLDRAAAADGPHTDFRMQALNEAIAALSNVTGARVAHIQMVFSDPTIEPRNTLDRKGAAGAYDAGPR